MKKIITCFCFLLLVMPLTPLRAHDGFARNQQEILDLLLKDGEFSTAKGADSGRVFLKVEFDFNSSRIKETAVPLVLELAKAMKSPRGEEMVVLLRGHTDSDGSEGANRSLSLRRVESVKDYLVDRCKVSAQRIKVEGCGEDEPLVPNENAASKALNRRLEVVNITVDHQTGDIAQH